MAKSIIWKISNFHCASCVKEIQDSLSKLAGVIEVQGDFISSQISITYDDSQINTNILTKTLSKIGYPVASTYTSTLQFVKNLSLRLLVAVSFIILLLSGYMDRWPENTKNIVLMFSDLIVMFWAGQYIYVRAYHLSVYIIL